MSDRRLGRRALEHAGVLAAYFGLALLLTYPLVLAPHRSIPIDAQIEGWFPGDGDPWHYLWGIWYLGQASSTFPPRVLWTDRVFFPIGFDLPFLPGVGLILGPGALLQPVLGLVLTYNVLWWLSFALAGSAMYRLARHLVGDRIVAFVCGSLFAFSSYRLIHSVEHLPIVLASFLLPLFALSLLRATEAPTVGRAVSSALVLAASTGISWYATVSLSLYLGIAMLVQWRQQGLGALRRVPVVSVLVGLGAFVVAASPFVLPLVLSPARDSIVDRPLAESSEYSADLLAFVVPSPRHRLLGAFTAPLYERFTGNPYEQTVYLGYVLLALAAVGVLASPRTTTRLPRVTAATAFVLALGPFLHVAGRSELEIGRETVSLPLPYLLIRFIPFVRGARVPSRFTELLLVALIVLAGYGLARACARLSTARKAAVAVVVLASALIETTLTPFPVLSTRAPAVYAEIARSSETGTVLEVPLDLRIIKYHYYQTVHGQRMLVGNPVRPRQKYADYPAGVPLIPYLREPRLLLDGPDPEDARRDAERLVDFFEIRHVVLHGEYLGRRVLERLDRFVGENFPHVSRRVDGTVIAYALGRPDPAQARWPERYLVDFGNPRREFALLTGWFGNERWGEDGPTMQWTSDRESSIVLWLGAPVARVLELRMHPLLYPGSPPQTVSVEVNGAIQRTLVLTPSWAVYRVPMPATAFRTGRNTVTFRYGYARTMASVVPDSRDTRTLAVAFDYLTLGAGP